MFFADNAAMSMTFNNASFGLIVPNAKSLNSVHCTNETYGEFRNLLDAVETACALVPDQSAKAVEILAPLVDSQSDDIEEVLGAVASKLWLLRSVVRNFIEDESRMIDTFRYSSDPIVQEKVRNEIWSVQILTTLYDSFKVVKDLVLAAAERASISGC